MTLPSPVLTGQPVKAPRRGRFNGLLPDRVLIYRVPQLWQELLLIAIGYALYTRGRNAVHEQESVAVRHGRSVEDLQTRLHLNFELSVNHFVADHEWLAQIMNYYYATLHFIVTIGVLVCLFRSHPRIYRGARTVLFLTTIFGLVGFYLYPLAPPRLMPQYGYIDTLTKFHTWGSLADPNVAEHSNQYAAMPSLHIGWSVWCALAVFSCARRWWVRVLAVAYPLATLMVIVGTANHFVIDAVGGLVVLGAALLVQWSLSAHGAFAETHETPRDSRSTAQPVES